MVQTLSSGSLHLGGGEHGVIGVELVVGPRAGEPRARTCNALKLILPLALARGTGWVPVFPTLYLVHVGNGDLESSTQERSPRKTK